MKKLPLTEIHVDPGIHQRVQVPDETVRAYANAMFHGVQFPPLTVFFDGQRYWLANGFIRYAALLLNATDEADVEVSAGIRHDAVLHAVGATHDGGLARTNADKRKAVTTLLDDTEGCQWSSKRIARWCHVSEDLVLTLRRARQNPPVPFVQVVNTRAAAKADFEKRKAAAIEGGTRAVTNRRLKRNEGTTIQRAIDVITGVVAEIRDIDPVPLSGDPRAEHWRVVVADTIGVLRALNRRLERKAV